MLIFRLVVHCKKSNRTSIHRYGREINVEKLNWGLLNCSINLWLDFWVLRLFCKITKKIIFDFMFEIRKKNTVIILIVILILYLKSGSGYSLNESIIRSGYTPIESKTLVFFFEHDLDGNSRKSYWYVLSRVR